MKTKLVVASMLALLSGNVLADELVVNDITIAQGGQAVLDIQMNNETELTAFQFDVKMAEGISVAKNEKGKMVYSMGDRFQDDDEEFTLSLSNPETNLYRFLGYHTVTCPISGNKGTIATATLEASSELTVGTTYYCTITNIVFTETSGLKHYPDDVTFAVTIDGVDDGRIHFDETSSNLPRYTAGEKGDVTMKRTIKGGVWNTIVLPFTLTKAKAEAAFGTDVQLSEFSGFETEYADEDDVSPDAIVINFTSYTMTARKGITGGKPFLIKTSKDVTEFEADDVTLTDVATSVEKADEYDTAGKFTGSLVKTVVPADGLFISDNKFWYSTGKTNIKAFRGWFELGAVLGKDTDFGAKVRFVIDDAPTSIEGIESANVDGDVYTLQGIYVGRDVEKNRLPKGIYIIDGKKTFVK